MLIIKDGQRRIVWHYGRPLPDIVETVVEFQADGDELVFILRALWSTATKDKEDTNES